MARKANKKATPKPAQAAALKKTPMAAPAIAPFLSASLQPQSFKTMESMMNKNTKPFEKISQDAANTSRESIEAFIKSGTIFAKGMEDIFRATISIAQDSAEKQAQMIKEAMSAKTMNEWAEFQNKMAKSSYEEFISNATRLSEMSSKLMTEASEPINAQVTKSMKKAQSMAA